MCRIGFIKSLDPIHPVLALKMMLPQQKGHDNSGFAIIMKDLYGIFEPYKSMPILSYSCTMKGREIIENFMIERGFSKQIFRWEPKYSTKTGLDFERMDFYGFDVFNYPEHLLKAPRKSKEEFLMDSRLMLRKKLEETNDGYVFSFWPDVLTIKEIGNPNDIGEYFNLWEQKEALLGKSVMIQYRQNTNYEIVRYAAHPFFLQGYVACANGENTFYLKNKEIQKNLHRAYIGFESDSQCFLYTLHYTHHELGWPLPYYKHVVTPLPFEQIEVAKDRAMLSKIRESLAHLEINGPNTIIGQLPDNTAFTVCDSKKLRPVVVGSNGRIAAITSEVTGINMIIPDRDTAKDIYPNERETVVIDNDLRITRWKQA